VRQWLRTTVLGLGPTSAPASQPAPPRSALPATQPARTLTLELGKGVTMKLIQIPPGKFVMGSPDNEAGRTKHEGPQREVTITNPFYLGVYDVTQEQYEAVTGENPSKFKGPTNPVEMVSWDDAADFCKKLSEKTARKVRLPTEAEWEFACRAGSKTCYFFGDDAKQLGDYAWFAGNSNSRTHPVGLKKPNAFGLYDMLGNVFQWCGDWYAEDYYGKGENVDPQGPADGSIHVLRGGSWINIVTCCRPADRGIYLPVGRSLYGFRAAVSDAGPD
jgi:formylglycine-generating enzyme required for sulfatase activity